MFKDKVLLITGGTGSFGNEVLKGFLDTDIKEIRIFSRDEKKQDDMRKRYNHPKLQFYLGVWWLTRQRSPLLESHVTTCRIHLSNCLN